MGSRSRYKLPPVAVPKPPKGHERLAAKAGTTHSNFTYGEAEAVARRHFGPNAAVRFFPGAKRRDRGTYHVGVTFIDKLDGADARLFGELGSGNSWRLAIADALVRIRRLTRAAGRADAAAAKAGNPAPGATTVLDE